MRVLGIDLGSRAVKIVIFEKDELLANKIIDTASFYREYCRNLDGQLAVDFERLSVEGFDRVVATGYGRNNVNIAGSEIIVELKAHTFGAVHQTGRKNFTLLDIGGQDSKVISVRNDRMADMLLNDKCAASCGRYLENMANILGISIDTLEKHNENPVELSSTCAVFGESELIGRISEGCTLEALAAGVNHSLFRRIKPMLERFPDNTLVVAGGVAQNSALIHFIREEMNFGEIIVPAFSQLNGAIGCCAYALARK